MSDPKGLIYALGDCAYVQGQPLPCTAQAAERQGRYLAEALSHIPSTEKPEPKPFVFKPWGMLAYVGGYKAIQDLPVGKTQGKLKLYRTDTSNFSVCPPVLHLLK